MDFLRDGRGVGEVVVEITERVQAEAELQESKAKLLAAQRLAKVRNWELAFQAGLDLATAPVEEMGSVGRENNCHSPEGLVVIGEEGFLPTTKLPRRQRASPYAT